MKGGFFVSRSFLSASTRDKLWCHTTRRQTWSLSSRNSFSLWQENKNRGSLPFLPLFQEKQNSKLSDYLEAESAEQILQQAIRLD